MTASVTAGDRQLSRDQITWAVAAIMFGGTPHLFSVVPWITLLTLALAAWRVAAAARGWRLPSLWLRVPFTLAGFAGVLFTYRSISGIDAGSGLLLVMAGMKLLETRTERDRLLVVFIGYMLLFAVFLREQAIWSSAWLIAAALGITTALMQTVRRVELLPARAGIALAGRLLLQALPLAAVLFVLFPRIPGPFWAVPNLAPGASSGLAEQISPGDITALSLSDEVAFRVRFAAAVPPRQALYWRGPVLERFDGRSWSAWRRSTGEQRFPARPAGTAAIGYEVVLEPHNMRWLLALDLPVSWSLARATLSDQGQLLSPVPVTERLSYRAQSVPTATRVVPADPQVLAPSLALPAGLNPRTVELARDLRVRAPSDRAFLAAALELFRSGGFTYSLTPPALGADSVDDFLFNTRSGFCEHYASALAVLARAGGLPARVVAGYQGGERNPLGDYWTIRQANAHAWVEVWLDGAWRRVDPTAVVAPQRIDSGIEAAFAGAPRRTVGLWRTSALLTGAALTWDAANAAWDRWILAYGPEAQENLLLSLGFAVPRPLQLAALAAAGSVACLALMGLALRHRDRRERDPAARLYLTLCRRLAAVVRPRGASESPEHYASVVAAARPDLGDTVSELTGLYLELRYGGSPDPSVRRRLAAGVRRLRPRRVRVPG